MRKVLLVGASGGIGNSVAQHLLNNGYSVIGTYFKHPEEVEKFSNNDNFVAHYLDISSLESVVELLDSIKDTKLYGVVNCSGIVKFEGESIDSDMDIWRSTLAVNLTGNFYLAKEFYNILEENGCFIMMSSTDSYMGGDITSAYATSKAGVNSLTKSLSLMFQDKKMRVNSIAPGWVETKMIEDNGEDFIAKVASLNPLKRNAKPQDVANLVEFLLSDKASYINGQIINIEGGYTNIDPTLLIESEGV